MSTPESVSGTVNRRAVLVVISFLVIGLVNVVRLLLWGADPLWGFGILPPVLFFTVLGWFAFKARYDQE